MRNVLVAVSVLLVTVAPAGAQAPPRPANTPQTSAIDPNHPAPKLANLPDQVAVSGTGDVPDAFLTDSAKRFRAQFNEKDLNDVSDTFHDTLVKGGFDVKAGKLIVDATDKDAVFIQSTPFGEMRVYMVPEGRSLRLGKTWVMPDGTPITFDQKPRTAPSTPTAPIEFERTARESVVYDRELFPWHVPNNVAVVTVERPAAAPGAAPADHIVIVNDFNPDADKPGDGEFKAAVNVSDSGFISGFTLIEGGCDFLDDGDPFSTDICSGKTPTDDPNGGWPNVMVQVLDQNGFRFVDNNSNPLVRDEARIEKVHILGGGGPELLGRGSTDVIEDLAPATYDDSVQYELITVRVSIQSTVKKGFNLLRDWLLRRPQEILAARSGHATFDGQSRPAPSRSAPSKSKPRSALSLLLTSTGASTGDAFRVHALANSPITFDLTSVVAEPLKGVKANAITRASTLFGARGASVATATGYCLEFTRRPPSAGMLYRIAPPAIQKRFEPLRRIGNAARKLADAGQLRPDSDPKSFVDSITQWAIWTGEQKFTQSSFTQAFVDHTRKAVEAAGRPWQREFAQVVEKAAPARWQQIQRILQVAGM